LIDSDAQRWLSPFFCGACWKTTANPTSEVNVVRTCRGCWSSGETGGSIQKDAGPVATIHLLQAAGPSTPVPSRAHFFKSETCIHFESGSNAFLILQSGSSQRDGHGLSIGHIPTVLAKWQHRFWQWWLAVHRVFVCMAAKIPSLVMAVGSMACAQVFQCSWAVNARPCLQCCMQTDLVQQQTCSKHTVHCLAVEGRQLVMQLVCCGPVSTAAKSSIDWGCQEESTFDLGRAPEVLWLPISQSGFLSWACICDMTPKLLSQHNKQLVVSSKNFGNLTSTCAMQLLGQWPMVRTVCSGSAALCKKKEAHTFFRLPAIIYFESIVDFDR